MCLNLFPNFKKLAYQSLDHFRCSARLSLTQRGESGRAGDQSSSQFQNGQTSWWGTACASILKNGTQMCEKELIRDKIATFLKDQGLNMQFENQLVASTNLPFPGLTN